MSRELHLLLGAYVLGGLDDAERDEFERHLGWCEQCRRELDELSGVPALLDNAMTDRDTAPPSPIGLATLLSAARDEHRHARRRRRAGLALAAAAVVVSGTVATVAAVASDEPSPQPNTVVALQAQAPGQLRGEVGLTRKPWGTSMTLTVSGLPHTGTFALQVVGASGEQNQAAAWAATESGKATVTGASAIAPRALRSLVVTTSDGTELAVGTP